MARSFVIASCLFLWFSGPVLAAESDCSEKLDAPNASGTGRPVLVLVETNPWAMVLGSDSPSFALYDNGLAIYRTKDGFHQIILNEQRLAELWKAMNVGALACLKKQYSIADMTDQPSENLFFDRGGRLSGISVYGRISGDREQTKLPPALVTAYTQLAEFSDAKSKPWVPDFIEVMVWPYEYAPDPSIIWPSKWPGLNDRTTVKRHDGYSLYVPAKDLGELRAFLGTERERGAVQIGGKKWAVSLRIPFPQESKWQFKSDDPE